MHSCGLGPESCDIMLNEAPGLGLKYDPSFSNQAGRDFNAEVVKYGKFICHVHAKDEIFVGQTTDYHTGMRKYRYAPTGMGDIHWGSVISLLYEADDEGDIAIEVGSSAWWTGDALERGLILAKRHLEQFIA